MNPLILCYTLSFIFSLIFLNVGVFIFRNKISVFYHLLFVSIAVSSLGYMQMATASSLGMAVIANQIVYAGATFTPLLMLMCFADLCKYKINRVFLTLCFIFIFLVISCVLFPVLTPLYYKNMHIVEKYGITLFKKNYGFVHSLYYVYVTSVNLYGLFIIFRGMANQWEVSYINSRLLLASMSMSFLFFIAQVVLNLNITIVPMSNLLSEMCVFILLVKLSLYDIKKISSQFFEESKTTGFILFDKNEKYLGADDTAKMWFPELSQIKLDQKIEKGITPIQTQIVSWFEKPDSEPVFFSCSDKIVAAKFYELKQTNGSKVYVIYLLDDTNQQKYTHLVEDYNNQLENAVEQKTERLFKIQNDIIKSMANIVEDRDNNTGGHVARTSDVVKIFVNHLKEKNKYEELSDSFAECVIKAAPLHDFGKISVPDVILNKPGKFTDEEYSIMKQHSEKGAVIVNKILNNAEDPVFKTIAVNVAHYHHEKWNGQGYPEGLEGTQIPFEARIMALADVFDALVSKRVYKESFCFDKAFDIMKESAGTHFCPQLCEDFIECRPQLEEYYSRR